MNTNTIKETFVSDGFIEESLSLKTIELIGGWDLFAATATKQSQLLLSENHLDLPELDVQTLSEYFGTNLPAITKVLMKETKAHGHKSPEYFIASRVPALRDAGITSTDIINILIKREQTAEFRLILQVIYLLVAKNLFDHYTTKYSNTMN